jgi:hypothetical protein
VSGPYYLDKVDAVELDDGAFRISLSAPICGGARERVHISLKRAAMFTLMHRVCQQLNRELDPDLGLAIQAMRSEAATKAPKARGRKPKLALVGPQADPASKNEAGGAH